MMLPRGQTLLLPANPAFIWASLGVGLALQIAQGQLSRAAWLPDWMALVLVFWNIHQPRRVSIGLSFLAGLLVDVHQGMWLGHHALAYTLMSYLATVLQRRVLWFGLKGQCLHVLLPFAVASATSASIRALGQGLDIGISAVLSPLLTSALWPLANWVLLAPQRRPPDPDATRPL